MNVSITLQSLESFSSTALMYRRTSSLFSSMDMSPPPRIGGMNITAYDAHLRRSHRPNDFGHSGARSRSVAAPAAASWAARQNRSFDVNRGACGMPLHIDTLSREDRHVRPRRPQML